ncbi:tumor necrosis factor receptor superfamily member 13C-like [Clinocottus analis]|uniref:tumor necrosis factor receptor superfamily member 13C-like n=1 Tax=Clinocottus analis TaxID=304258 RepID=UPI0035C1239D
MAREDCPAGKKWDSLVGTCVLTTSETRPEPEAPVELPPVGQLRPTAPTAQAHSVVLLSPALWIFVVLATLGSILALALWFIIYKRQTRHRSQSEDAGLQQEPLQKTEPPAKSQQLLAERLQRASWAPSPCPHLHLEAQAGTNWEEGLTACSDFAKHAGTDGVRGLPTCSTREHRIPLPATEMGGTALVTTKTV